MHCYGRAAKRRRDRKYKRKLKRLHSFGTTRPAIRYVDADYPYKTVNKPYFVKSYKSLGRNKGRYYTYKKVSNRKVRYYKGDLFNGNAYKKLFDLW